MPSVVADMLNPPSQDGILDKAEMVMGTIGLNTPIKRFVFFNAMTGAIVWGLKPAVMFDPRNGNPRPWILINSKRKDATSLPWFLPGLITGVLTATFL